MAPSPSRPSLASLARELGVSVATVSNAYNRPDKLSASLRERVLAHAATVGYGGPHPTGRALRRGRTDVVGLVFTDELAFAFSDPASAGFFGGLAGACEARGRTVLLLPAGATSHPADAMIASASVDAFVVHSVREGDPCLDAVARRGLPAVVVDQPGPQPGVDWVGLDEHAAMSELGAHLAALGHRHVGIVTTRLARERHDGPGEQRVGDALYSIPRARVAALQESLGADAAPLVVEERHEVSIDAGASAARDLLARDARVTAVCAVSDVHALGVLAHAGRAGLEVPRDLSVAGFDDAPASSWAGLTTVSQPLRRKGRAVGHVLDERLAEGTGTGPGDVAPLYRTTLATTLRVRGSTGPAPTRRS